MPRHSTCSNERTCEVCGTVVQRKPGEDCNYFVKRKVCSESCRRKLIGNKKPQDLSETRTCVECGKPFTRRPDGESFAMFRARECCSRTCSSRRNWREKQRQAYGDDLERERRCATCGTVLVRKDREPMFRFMTRRTCDTACGHRFAGMNKRIPDEWKRGEYLPEFNRIKVEIRERDGHLCRICGAAPGRVAHPVHHIDYDKSNNDPANLITLCQACHNKTHTKRETWMAFFHDMLESES